MRASTQGSGPSPEPVQRLVIERIAFDAGTGQPFAGSFMDHAMPRAADKPTFPVDGNLRPTVKNPLGAEAAGEVRTVGALPSRPAAAPDMPAAPDRLWRVVADAHGG